MTSVRGACFRSEARGSEVGGIGRRADASWGRNGCVRIELRHLGGRSLHCPRERRDSVTRRGGFDCGRFFCRQNAWTRYLVVDRDRNHGRNLGRDRRLLDRQKVRTSATGETWGPSGIDGRADQNRPVAVRSIRRTISSSLPAFCRFSATWLPFLPVRIPWRSITSTSRVRRLPLPGSWATVSRHIPLVRHLGTWRHRPRSSWASPRQ